MSSELQIVDLWEKKQENGTRVGLLTDQGLYDLTLDKKPLRNLKEAIQSQTDFAEFIPSKSKIIPLEKITQLRYQQDSEQFSVSFINHKEKAKKAQFEVASKEDALFHVEKIGSMIGCSRPSRVEDATVNDIIWGPLWVTGIIVALAAGGTYMLLHPEEMGEGSTRSARRGRFMYMIAEMITMEGLIAIGALSVVICVGYLAYKLKKRPQVNFYESQLSASVK
ncbi:hypothetical protein Pla110_16070 [Polystyrenella longa]|uniref:Uncharacterized protein n=1 Tax=Polystyrenella longa TaxID=2528007 RepID=A0A518CKZ0_9PLAN|nr:hypothetical protein [Polystyrenella longa]QDU79887.1 hypothetical protein Pla110_16070 [Polystyrenella longa]